jgi:hypothetical protein
MPTYYSSCIWLLLVLISTAVAFESRSKPEVVTKLGEIHGRRLIDYGDRVVDGFYAIPYAKAPIGELRFKVGVIYPLVLCIQNDRIKKFVYESMSFLKHLQISKRRSDVISSKNI